MDLHCYYQNVNGLRTKTQLFFNAVSIQEYDIICITESGLSSDVSSEEVFPTSYLVFRSDRDIQVTGHCRGGGAVIAVKSNLNAIRLNLESIANVVPSVDVVGCKVTINNTILLVFTIYIPPSTTAIEYEAFLDALEGLSIFEKNCNLLICGDFNVAKFNVDPNDVKVRLINNFMSFLDINQYNMVLNGNGRLLDLVFGNFNYCNVNRDSIPLVKEDIHHPSLIIDFKLNIKSTKNFSFNNNTDYNFRRANFHQLYDKLLQTDWSCLELYSNVDETCDVFYTIINKIFDECVPKFKKTSRSYPPWYSAEIKNNIRCKELAYKNYKKYKTEYYLNQFKFLRTTIKRQLDSAYRDYVSVTENEIVHDPSKFWSFVQYKRGKSRIPGTVTYDNETLDSPQMIVDSFANFFSSVYSKSDPSHTNDFSLSHLSGTININSVTENDILQAIKKLKNKMTTGIDGVPSFVVRDCAAVFVTPLCIIFNMILTASKFPDIWKITRICPILKTGDPSSINNYRPIAILCNFAKTFEIILYTYIYSAVKPSISFAQHGFMAQRSTVTNLACVTQFISDSLDAGGQVDVIYTDIQKAFDQIDHYLLLSKLESFGFSDTLILLFTSYLFCREQFVEHGGHRSRNYIATSGVPQGSNLGPLLFLIFMNDITSIIGCHQLLFADDLKIYMSINNLNDCVQLQAEIDHVSVWCSNNYLKLNTSKCKIMTFTRRQNSIQFDYNIDNFPLQRCSEYKDLGVLFDCKLSFSSHINQMTKAASKLLGFFVRNWSCFSHVDSLKILYFSYIRSKLEYAALIWFPIYQNFIVLIESVQRKFLKYLFYKSYRFYPQRGTDNEFLLQTFNIISLKERRSCIAISFLYNLMHNNIDCPCLVNKLCFLVPRLNSRESECFYCPFGRTNLMHKSPIFNICNLFNSISDECDINYDSLGRIINLYLRTNC